MSKADSLLKKVAVYERLALYSDRKAFLQALAQNQTPAYPTSLDETNPGVAPYMDNTQTPATGTSALNPSDKALLEKARGILQSVGLDASAIVNATLFGNVDWNAIRREIQDSWMTGKLSPLSQQAQISSLQNILSNLGRSASTQTQQTHQQARPQQAHSQQGGSKEQYVNQLISSMNGLIKSTPASDDPFDKKREYVAGRIDKYIMAELLRIYRESAGSEPGLATKIKDAASAFGNAFPQQMASAANYAKLTQTL